MWVQARPATASPQFLNKLIGLVHCYVNPNTIHGNITEREAHQITMTFCEELIFDLAFEGENMGVKQENYGAIVRAMDTLIFMTLTRAISDGERNNEALMFHTSEIQKSDVRGKI